MTGIRSYLAGTGASGSLLLAALVAFVSVTAFVAFEGVPIGSGADDAETVSIDGPGSAAATAVAAAGPPAAVAAAPAGPAAAGAPPARPAPLEQAAAAGAAAAGAPASPASAPRHARRARRRLRDGDRRTGLRPGCARPTPSTTRSRTSIRPLRA